MPTICLDPARTLYRGSLTRPERWDTWAPRTGDVLVATPSKCGTTWTQTMLAMLIHGATDLPAPLGALSPWVDSDLGTAEEVRASLAAQPGRRVIKSHTPGDGLAVWDGVTVVAVYRHPLDMFFSLRKHAANMAAVPDHPMRAPIPEALAYFLEAPFDPEKIDSDSLALVEQHFRQTTRRDRFPQLHVMHYADMIADHRGTVAALAGLVGRAGDDALIDAVTAATRFASMKAEASKYAPEGGKGFWADDAAFFDQGGTGKWQDRMSPADIARFTERMEALVPDSAERGWLLEGAAHSGWRP